LADVFVSYSRKDLARSEAIASFLRREHVSVAIDRDFLQVGDAYRDSIAAELKRAKVVIVLWSRDSVESEFVRDEASRARHTVLLQLVIDDLPDSDVPLGFGELQRLHCQWTNTGQLAPESGEALLAALKRHLPAVEPLDKAIDELRREVDRRLGSECEVLERIGTGRMSIVFRAQHRVYGLVALKVIPLAGILLLPGLYAEFRGNIEVTRKLSHANILGIRDVRLLDTIACTIIDYVDGDTLAHVIATNRSRLTLGCIKDIAMNIADALVAAHTQRIVHCALSPTNILIERRTDRPLVRDFGMPTVSGGAEATAARAMFLDPRYMSPEQCMGQPATPQSDQYALGAILYEMLTGRAPFVGSSAFMIMRGHCDAAPVPISELRPNCPPAVADSVMRMLSKNPQQRYFTTQSVRREIESWPLAESMRLDPIHPGSSLALAAKAALDSYNRCLTDASFLTLFYQRLRADSAVGEKLGTMMFDSQVELIKPAIRHLLEAALGQDSALAEVDRMGGRHARYGLTELNLRTFIDTLIDVVVELESKSGGDAPALRASWQMATECGLARFAQAASVTRAPAPLRSGVVPRRDASDASADRSRREAG
jgi:hypothetical protein